MEAHWLCEAVRFAGFPFQKAKEFYPTELFEHISLHDANLKYPFYVEPDTATGILIVDLDWFWHKHLVSDTSVSHIVVFGFQDVRAIQYPRDADKSADAYRGIGGAKVTELAESFVTDIEMLTCPGFQILHGGVVQVLVYQGNGHLVDIPWVRFQHD